MARSGKSSVSTSLRRSLRQKLSFLKRRLIKPALPRNADGKVLLHIGCGPVRSPEFVNVDALPYAHVHVVTDNIEQLSGFSNESADLIYMCHVLEHMMRPRLESILREMHRILKPGGILRLSVPDFDRLVEVYEGSGRDMDAISEALMGGQHSQYNVHYGVFNRRSLSELLVRCGFRSTRSWDPLDCEHHDFKDKACKMVAVGGRRIPISLNLEAVK